MPGQRLRRWPNIEPTLNKCTMFEKSPPAPTNTRHLYNIYTTWANVFNVGQTLHKVIQMFCVYWDVNTNLGSSSFNIPAVIQSVCLQASDQVGARAKSFELLTHRCR